MQLKRRRTQFIVHALMLAFLPIFLGAKVTLQRETSEQEGGTQQDLKKNILTYLDRIETKPDSSHFSTVVEYLQMADPEVYSTASRVMRKVPEWQRLTIELATSQQPRYRLLAVKILSLEIQNEGFAKEYITLITDPVSSVRRRASEVAMNWKDSPFKKTIRESFFKSVKEEQNKVVKASLLIGLSHFADETCAVAFFDATKSESPEVRGAGIAGLGILTDRGAAASSSAVLKDVAERARKTLIQIATAPGVTERERMLTFPYVGRNGGFDGKMALRGIASSSKGSEIMRTSAQEAYQPKTEEGKALETQKPE